VIRGAETLAHYREREESWSGEKPQFGDVAKVTGGEWEDVGPPVVEAVRVRVQEAAQKAVAEGEERVFGGPLVR
jgi:ABC-type taurine transport system substrate-binding protein